MRKIGTLIDNLKQKGSLPTKHDNPYLKKALDLEDVMSTQSEIFQRWPNLFKDSSKPIVIEIGCYLGKNLMECAEANPNINFLGLDITYKRVVKTASKIKSKGLSNAHVTLCDGHVLFENIIKDKSILGVCIFFPDPWPKDRHEKKRLLNRSMISLLKEKLVAGGFVWFKTDHEPYFRTTHALLTEHGFKTSNLDVNMEPYATESMGKDGPSALGKMRLETQFQKLFNSKCIKFFDWVYLNE